MIASSIRHTGERKKKEKSGFLPPGKGHRKRTTSPIVTSDALNSHQSSKIKETK